MTNRLLQESVFPLLLESGAYLPLESAGDSLATWATTATIYLWAMAPTADTWVAAGAAASAWSTGEVEAYVIAASVTPTASWAVGVQAL